MKKLIIIFLVLLGCKDQTKEKLPEPRIEQINLTKQPELKNSNSCENIISKILKSSSLGLEKNDENTKFRIEEKNNNKITIQVYTTNNTSDINKSITEVTIAWLVLNTTTRKLNNATLDPENPKEVSFDTSIFKSYKFYENCKIFEKKSKIIDLDFDNRFKKILNAKLVGLSVIDKNNKDVYKKYGIDFSTVCNCDSPSFYIKEKLNEIIVYNYCNNEKKLGQLEHSYKFKMVDVKSSDNNLTIITEPYLKFTFSILKENTMYNLIIEGEFPTKYIGNQLKKIFTTQPKKFYEEDCGDYEG